MRTACAPAVRECASRGRSYVRRRVANRPRAGGPRACTSLYAPAIACGSLVRRSTAANHTIGVARVFGGGRIGLTERRGRVGLREWSSR